MKMPDLTLFDGFDGLGLGEGFMWDGAAGRDVPSLLRWLVETGSLTISPPESVAIEQHAAEEISIEGSDAAEPSAAALIGLVISKMQAVAEARCLVPAFDGADLI
jgi:hypothetical protein